MCPRKEHGGDGVREAFVHGCTVNGNDVTLPANYGGGFLTASGGGARIPIEEREGEDVSFVRATCRDPTVEDVKKVPQESAKPQARTGAE